MDGYGKKEPDSQRYRNGMTEGEKSTGREKYKICPLSTLQAGCTHS